MSHAILIGVLVTVTLSCYGGSRKVGAKCVEQSPQVATHASQEKVVQHASQIVVRNKTGRYQRVNISPLTPPSYVFPIAWSCLYTMIGLSGALIWRAHATQTLRVVKGLYVTQLALNLSWPTIFFKKQLVGLSLLFLIVMDVAVAAIIYLTRTDLSLVAKLMTPYFGWLLFATYLTFYIWFYN